MMWKKNFLSIILWLVYFISVTAAMMYYVYNTAIEKNFAGSALAASLPIFLLGGVFLLFFLFRLIVTKIPVNHLKERTYPVPVVEGILFIAMITAGLALRIWYFKYAPIDTGYFELAKVTENGAIPQIAHGATFFYTYLLHHLFVLVGNHFVAGIWLQLILQVIASILIYFGIRKLSGAVAGIVCLGLVMLLPHEIMRGLKYSPDMLYLCFYGVGLILIANVIGNLVKNKPAKSCAPLLIITGAWIGFVCYMDITGVTLLVIALSVFCVKNTDWSKSLVQFLVLILLTLLCFIGYIWLDALSCSKGIADILNAWIEMYQVKEVDPLFWYTTEDNLLWIVTFISMIFGSLGFWTCGKFQRFNPWVLLFAALFGINCFQLYMQNMNAGVLMQLICYTLIGVGIGDGLLVERSEKSEGADMISEDMYEEEVPHATEEGYEEEQIFEQMIEEEPQPMSARVTYIQNPLPLPKKHVKKVLDYSIQPPEEELCYDFDVAEDDDFDL